VVRHTQPWERESRGGGAVFLHHEVGAWYWKGRWLNRDGILLLPPMKMMFDLGFAQPVGAWPPTMDSA
jgi:hypothetical protein